MMTKANLKVLTGVTGLALAVALVGGSTMAWFTDSKPVAGAAFTAGTVKISAGRTVVADSGDPSGKYYREIKVNPDGIVYHRGEWSVPVSRQNPSAILNPSTSAQDGDMCSLGGPGGYLIARLDCAEGALDQGDVLVVEDTWNGSQPAYVETAEVWVSQDGDSWTDAGPISNRTDPKGNYHDCLVSCPVSGVQFIKLTDTTPETSKSTDGFDVDYLCGRQIVDETNWNPGDTNKIAYYVRNDGSKDISLRAKLTGKWVKKDGGDAAGLSDSVITIPCPDGWTKDGDYYYYTGSDGLKGTAGGETDEARGWPSAAEMNLNVTLSGPDTDNAYQGMTYQITPTFEAIQASHQASGGSGGWSWDRYESYH